MPISEYNGAMARAATTSDVFNAIAEPQRREILVLLRAGERPVTELAQELRMTQPGASKHLRVLREVGLVRDRKAGNACTALTSASCDRFTSGPAGSSGSGTRASTGWTSTCRTSSRQGRGVAGERDGTRSAGAVLDGRPRDRD